MAFVVFAKGMDSNALWFNLAVRETERVREARVDEAAPRDTLSGMSWRFAAQLGALMNTRGLMELIVLTVGLKAGIITPRLFTMMVIMAVVTTAMTAPLLDLIAEDGREQ